MQRKRDRIADDHRLAEGENFRVPERLGDNHGADPRWIAKGDNYTRLHKERKYDELAQLVDLNFGTGAEIFDIALKAFRGALLEEIFL